MTTSELSNQIRETVVSILESQGIAVEPAKALVGLNGSASQNQFCPMFAVDIGDYEVRASAIDRGDQRVWTLFAWPEGALKPHRLDTASALRFVSDVVPLIETMAQHMMRHDITNS